MWIVFPSPLLHFHISSLLSSSANFFYSFFYASKILHLTFTADPSKPSSCETVHFHTSEQLSTSHLWWLKQICELPPFSPLLIKPLNPGQFHLNDCPLQIFNSEHDNLETSFLSGNYKSMDIPSHLKFQFVQDILSVIQYWPKFPKIYDPAATNHKTGHVRGFHLQKVASIP